MCGQNSRQLISLPGLSLAAFPGGWLARDHHMLLNSSRHPLIYDLDYSFFLFLNQLESWERAITCTSKGSVLGDPVGTKRR